MCTYNPEPGNRRQENQFNLSHAVRYRSGCVAFRARLACIRLCFNKLISNFKKIKRRWLSGWSTYHACDAPHLDVHIQTRRHGGCLLGGRANGRLLEVANPGRVRELGSTTRPSLINTVGSNREGQLLSINSGHHTDACTHTNRHTHVHTHREHACVHMQT